MKLSFLCIAAALLAFASCSKSDIKGIEPEPTPASVSGRFTITYDSTRFIIDSIQGYYLTENGTLDSTVVRNSYTWESPTRRYDQFDSGYARVFAWGVRRVLGAEIPALKFSETFQMARFSSSKGDTLRNGKDGFRAAYGFRY